MVQAIARELVLRKTYLPSAHLQTIYLGGGTPSILSLSELELIFQTIRTHYTIDPIAEITLEANPEDLTSEALDTYLHFGINRLSIGIQSMDSQVLSFLNRNHTPAESLQAIQRSRSAGFSNLNVDLIYAIPGRTDEVWKEDIQTMLALKPEHISAYSLTVEEATVLGRWAKTGKFTPAEDDWSFEQLEHLIHSLEASGYNWYEVSNFAKPGKESRHNSAYWKGIPYLGIGPSAHSFDGIDRYVNVANNFTYLKDVNANKIPGSTDQQTTADRINDYILTSLRTHWGSDLNKLKTEFGHDLKSSQQHYLENLVNQGFAEWLTTDNLRLTRKGRMIADKIALDLFVEQF